MTTELDDARRRLVIVVVIMRGRFEVACFIWFIAIGIMLVDKICFLAPRRLQSSFSQR